MQALADAQGGELSAAELYDVFRERYLEATGPYELLGYKHEASDTGDRLTATVRADGEETQISGSGNGPIAALVHAAAQELGLAVRVVDYHEHAMSTGEDATAAAYIEADVDGEVVWGVGIHASIVTASLRAVVNAVNRAALVREERAAALRAFDTA